MSRVQPGEPVIETERLYPRSLEQAFGPYARNCEIVPLPDAPMHPADVLVIKVSAWCLAALALLFTAEWFKPEWFQ